MGEHTLDRRTFVKATGATGLAVLGAGLLGETRGRASSGKVEITMWEHQSPPEEAALLVDLKTFEQKYPNIVIKRVRQDFGTTFEKVTSAVAAGTGPDISPVYSGLLSQFASQGAVIPLDQFGAGSLQSQYFAPAWSYCTYQGHVYGLPYANDPRYLIYNQRLFEQAGLNPAKPPTTWDQVIQYAQRLTKRDSRGNLRVAGLAIPTDGTEEQIGFFLTTMYQFGGSNLLNENRTKATFNNEYGIKALQLMVDLQHKYNITPPPPASQANNESGFDAGKIAMYIYGKWGVQSAHQYAPGIPLGVAPWPYPSGGRPGNYVTVGAYMIYKHCQNPEQAYTFIKWMTGTQAENARMLNYNVSPRRDATSDPQIRALEGKIPTIKTEQFVPQGVTLPYTPKMAQILKALGPDLQAAVTKSKTVAQALKDAEANVNNILNSQL